MISKRSYKFLLFFLISEPSFESHAKDLIPLILSFPGDRHSRSTLEIIKSKSNASDVRLTFDEEDLRDCNLLKSVSIKNNLNFWKKSESCELLVGSLKKEVLFLKGNTLFIHPLEYDCTRSAFSGYAYLCKKN